MKVLFITHYSSLYGANRSLLALIDGLDQTDIKPFVAVPNSGDLIEELKKRNIKYYIFPFKNWMSQNRLKMPFRLLMNLIGILWLKWKVRNLNLNLVHTNSSVTPIGAWLAQALRVPHIWHIREFGWEDYQLKYDFGRKYFEFWLNKSDHIITVSKVLKISVLQGITTPISVIYNGVITKEQIEKVEKESKHKINVNETEKLVFGIIGLLNSAKGQDDAIRAFGQVHTEKDIELWIAGSGPDEYVTYLKNIAGELECSERIKFLGYVDDPFKFYQDIDIVLVCSGNEGMGRVTAEAMVAGKPIIGLNNAGTSELIEDGETGILYDGNVESLKIKMEYATLNDLSRLAKNAKEIGKRNFLIDQYANNVISVIKKVSL